MLLKPIKRFKQGSLYNFKDKNNTRIVHVFNENMEIQRKLMKNSLLDVKTYFYFLREDGFDIKIM